MKSFTFLLFIFLTSITVKAQLATFDWVKDTLSFDNRLKGMTLSEEGESPVIVGYDNTFLKSNNKGISWQSKSMFMPLYDYTGMGQGEDILFISSRQSKIVNNPSDGFPDVYLSGIILKSLDMGKTWEVLDINSAEFNANSNANPNAEGGYAKDIYAIDALNKDTIVAYIGWDDKATGTKTDRGAVFRTNDGGSTWFTLTEDLGNNTIASVEIQDSVAVFGGSKNLYISNLISGSVTNIYPNLAVGTDSNLYVSNITFLSPEEFYVTTTLDGIFKTNDQGQTFTRLGGIDGSNDLIVINDSTLLALGTSSKSKLSTNNGTNWIDCYPGKTSFKIGGILNDTLYALASEVAFKCAVSDLLKHTPDWKEIKLFEDKLLRKMAIFENNNAVISGYGGNCIYTSDGGQTWSNSQLPVDYLEDIELDFNSLSANGNSAYATVRRFKIADLSEIDSVHNFYMEGLIVNTQDNWETSSLLDASLIGKDEGNDPTKNPQLEGCWGLNPFLVECVSQNTAYIFANWYEDSSNGSEETCGRVFKTDDGGTTWTVVTSNFGSSYITSIEFSNDTGYIGGNNILQKTADGGLTIIDLYPKLIDANDGDDRIFIQSIHLVNNDELYIPTTSDGVFYTKDGGESFSKLKGIEGTTAIRKFDDNSFLCMGSTSKSLFTNDGGETWQTASANDVAYSIGEIINDTLYVLGNGIIMKVAIEDLDLKTSIPTLFTKAELKVAYTPTSINLISTNGEIEHCSIYTINGSLVTQVDPNNSIYRLNNNEYKSGIYLVNSIVGSKRYINKIAIR
ncbi:hypothetical protein [uncultured Draconibacterium sp.]|uniref:hypothetical protein n=1 Tax=uncultured Draconibacterium sp. TaxID=1573823 RepID=UPI0029C6F2B6|nr:hypothetical protein [uncultured Draconibacterium sp.]